jgi:hypothetical protein
MPLDEVPHAVANQRKADDAHHKEHSQGAFPANSSKASDQIVQHAQQTFRGNALAKPHPRRLYLKT